MTTEQIDATSTPQPLDTVIRATSILRLLKYGILVVICLHLLALLSQYGFSYDYLKGLVPMFNLEHEQNVPTFFSSLQLLIAAALLSICTLHCGLSRGSSPRLCRMERAPCSGARDVSSTPRAVHRALRSRNWRLAFA